MKLFFDGSEGRDESGNQWLTLAGYIGSDCFWTAFHRGWQQMLAAREPEAPYIHMREIVSGRGCFTKDRGWTEVKTNRLILDAVYFLQGLDKSGFCAVACSIDLTARQRLVSEGCEITKPQLICTQCCVGTALNWYHENLPDKLETAHVFFDKNEAFMHEFRQEWLKHRKPRRLVTDELMWGLIADIDAVEMTGNPPLQAADMMAWATTRKLSNKTRPYRELATILTAVVPHGRLVLDSQTLRDKHCPTVLDGNGLT